MKKLSLELVNKRNFNEIKLPRNLFSFEKMKLFYIHSFIAFFKLEFASSCLKEGPIRFEKLKPFLKQAEEKMKNPKFTYSVNQNANCVDL